MREGGGKFNHSQSLSKMLIFKSGYFRSGQFTIVGHFIVADSGILAHTPCMSFTVDEAFAKLKKGYEAGRLAHAYLIIGPVGSGKDELACRLSELLNGARAQDVASGEGDLFRVVRPGGRMRTISVDKIRKLEESMVFKTGGGQWKIAVIQDADRFRPESANCFLKTLEEPAANTLILLLTANPASLLPTILSRCVKLSLRNPAQRPRDATEAEFIEALAAVFAKGFVTNSEALQIQGVLSAILNRTKISEEKLADDQFKNLKKRYRDRVEAGDWLSKKEDELKAVAKSKYLLTRSRLIDLMVAWLGDVMRIKGGGSRMDVPELEAVSRNLANQETLPRLVQRVDALEQMRNDLETNATEALVLEVGCLGGFAA